VNPALTIMANAIRVGDHLLGRLGVTTTTENRQWKSAAAAAAVA